MIKVMVNQKVAVKSYYGGYSTGWIVESIEGCNECRKITIRSERINPWTKTAMRLEFDANGKGERCPMRPDKHAELVTDLSQVTPWQPFPPPRPGIYTVRDANGQETENVRFVELRAGVPLYCVAGGSTIGRVDRMARAGFQWRRSAD